jgi:hypothetical protein
VQGLFLALWGELQRETAKNFYRCRVGKLQGLGGTLAET